MKRSASTQRASLTKEVEALIDGAFDKLKSSVIETLEDQRLLAKEQFQIAFSDPNTSTQAMKNLETFSSTETLSNIIKDISTTIDGLMRTLETNSNPKSDRIIGFKKENLQQIAEIPTDTIMASKCIESIVKKNLLALGDARGHLYLWEADTLRPVQSIRAFTTWITCINYSESQDYLFVGSAECKFKVFKFTKNRKISLMKVVNTRGTVFGLLPLDNSKLLLMSGVDMGVSVWKLSSISKKGMLSPKGNEGVGHNLSLIEKYNMAAVGYSSGQISIYDLKTGQEYASTQTGKNNWYIYHLLFIEEHNHLLAYISQGKIGCWKFNYQEKKLTMTRTIKFIDYNLRSLVPANNGRTILINAGSRFIYGYDWNSEILYEVYKGNDVISCFRSIPDNRILVSEHPSKCVILSYK